MAKSDDKSKSRRRKTAEPKARAKSKKTPAPKAKPRAKSKRAPVKKKSSGARSSTTAKANPADPRAPEATPADPRAPEAGIGGDTRRAPVPLGKRVAVAIHEGAPSSERRAREIAGAVGYRVLPQRDPEEIIKSLTGVAPPEILLLALPESAALVEKVRALPIAQPIIVASLAGPILTARDRYRRIDSDLFVVRPHSLESLCTALHAATVVHAKEELIRTQRGTEQRLRDQVARTGESGDLFGFQNMAFFQRLLVMEIKRAKRFGYSLAACLVAPDPFEGNDPSKGAQRELVSRVAASISASIRDIDMPVDYAEDRLLLFLPYTDLDGAREVGERVARVAAGSGRVMDGNHEVRMSVSIGIAALSPGKPVSFARLIRDASSALRAAQLKGGGRVVVRK